jgi:hypothetical protein
MRSPNARCITPATRAATSMPTSSSSVQGPTGKPKSVIARSSASTAAPSSSTRVASFM